MFAGFNRTRINAADPRTVNYENLPRREGAGRPSKGGPNMSAKRYYVNNHLLILQRRRMKRYHMKVKDTLSKFHYSSSLVMAELDREISNYSSRSNFVEDIATKDNVLFAIDLGREDGYLSILNEEAKKVFNSMSLITNREISLKILNNLAIAHAQRLNMLTSLWSAYLLLRHVENMEEIASMLNEVEKIEKIKQACLEIYELEYGHLTGEPESQLISPNMKEEAMDEEMISKKRKRRPKQEMTEERAAQKLKQEVLTGKKLQIDSGLVGNIDNNLEENVDHYLEEDADNNLKESVENDLVESVDNDLEENVDSDLEENADNDLKLNVDSDLEENVDNDLDKNADNDLEENTDSDLEENVDSDLEENADNDLKLNVDSDLEENVDNDSDKNADNNLDESSDNDSDEDYFMKALKGEPEDDSDIKGQEIIENDEHEHITEEGPEDVNEHIKEEEFQGVDELEDVDEEKLENKELKSFEDTIKEEDRVEEDSDLESKKEVVNVILSPQTVKKHHKSKFRNKKAHKPLTMFKKKKKSK